MSTFPCALTTQAESWCWEPRPLRSIVEVPYRLLNVAGPGPSGLFLDFSLRSCRHHSHMVLETLDEMANTMAIERKERGLVTVFGSVTRRLRSFLLPSDSSSIVRSPVRRLWWFKLHINRLYNWPSRSFSTWSLMNHMKNNLYPMNNKEREKYNHPKSQRNDHQLFNRI